MIKKKKFDVEKAMKNLGIFCIIRRTDGGHLLNVENYEVVYFYNGREIKREPFSEEILAELEERDIPFKIIEAKEFERVPPNKVILGRLELGRIGIWEE
ncbi:MAG: hypothetical protein ACTSWZ_07730 [Candidatus Heimdallarchaeaceae archaeon]